MRGKILYLPVASLPEDPLMGCTIDRKSVV